MRIAPAEVPGGIQGPCHGDPRIAAPAHASHLDTWTVPEPDEDGSDPLTCEILSGDTMKCNRADSEEF
jgi:hypothetical protein